MTFFAIIAFVLVHIYFYMFAKNSHQGESAHLTVIGSSLKIEGTFVSEEDVEFHGSMKGDMKVNGDICFTESADIIGNVEAQNIIIKGNLQGDCTAEGDICIEKRGVLKGDANVGEHFTVKPGATFLGSSKMIEKADVEIDGGDDDDDDLDLDDL